MCTHDDVYDVLRGFLGWQLVQADVTNDEALGPRHLISYKLFTCFTTTYFCYDLLMEASDTIYFYIYFRTRCVLRVFDGPRHQCWTRAGLHGFSHPSDLGVIAGLVFSVNHPRLPDGDERIMIPGGLTRDWGLCFPRASIYLLSLFLDV